MNFNTINPATEEIIREYQEYSDSEIENILLKSQVSFDSYKKISFSDRAKMLLEAASILKNEKEKFAVLMAQEMGKPITQGIAEAEKCAWVCEYYAINAEEQLKDIEIKTEYSKSFISFLPIGPVLAIMPWNFPFWQVFRFAAPNLMAGNVGLLKHSRNTMGCAIAIEDILLRAGFPNGVFQNLIIGSYQVRKFIEHKSIVAVTLTGSAPAGSDVARIAGNSIKKTVLELGGSDPYIILEDADLVKTVDSCVLGRFINTGQSCIAAKRFIVIEDIYDKFIELFTEKTKLLKIGSPLDSDINLGPLARKDLKIELDNQVKKSIAEGAKLVIGGDFDNEKGFYYNPTILIDVKNGMAAFDEELFGPVAVIIRAENEKEAVELANHSIFGLGAAIFTNDIVKGERIAKYELQAGACFVNDYVRSDPRLPFGGIKDSGYGRELSPLGINEFINAKTICVK